MVVVVLVGQADRFSHQILSYFQDKYVCKYFKEPFNRVKFELTNQNSNVLYLVPDLTKPERYEIYCLTRKNQQTFITIVDKLKDESCNSDKNPLFIKEFNGPLLEEAFENKKIAKSSANERSKISLKNLSDLKEIFNKVNQEYKDIKMDIILKECEERMIKAWRINPKISNEEVEKSYKQLIKSEMERKGFVTKF